jgi:hypothetical protein
MRKRLGLVISLLLLITATSALVPNSTFEYLFEFNGPGYSSQVVSFNETIPLNRTSVMEINITRSGTQGVNYTIVVNLDENATILPDYNDYNSTEYPFMATSRNVTADLLNLDETSYKYGGLLLNGTGNPHKILIIIYYEGTGPGNIRLKVSMSTAVIEWLDPNSTVPMRIPLYLTIISLLVIIHQRKIRKHNN